MKSKNVLLWMAMVLSSMSFAQSKSEMPFTSKSDEAKKLVRTAWAAYADARVEEGNALILKARELDPDFALTFTIGVDGSIREHLKRAQQLKASDDERLYISALGALTENKSIDAFVEPLLKKYPNDKYLNMQISYLYFSSNPNRTRQILEGIIKRDSKFAPAYNLLGYSYMRLNEMQQAEASFDKYISLRPNLANPYDSKAEFLEKNGKYEEAAKLYDKAAEMGMTVSKMRAERCRGKLLYPPIPDSDKEAIKTVILLSAKAHVEEDLESLLQSYAGQAIEIFENQMTNVGKENIMERIKSMFNYSDFEKVDLAIDNVSGFGKVAVALGTAEIRIKNKSTGEVVDMKDHVIFFLRKQNDNRWRILVDHTFGAADDAMFIGADRTAVQQVLGKWVNFGVEILSNEKIVELSDLYSDQAIEIYPNQRSNIGKANLLLRWKNFLGIRFDDNALGLSGIEGLGKRAVAWGVGYQKFYSKDSADPTISRFPWVMLFSKERDDEWRILAAHWYAD